MFAAISFITELLASVADDDYLARLFDRLDDLCVVERNDGAGVDDLGGDAVLLLERLSRLESTIEYRTDGQDSDITLALDIRSPISTS